MKRITAIWKHAFLLIVILSAVCLLGNTQKVSAASYSETTCKVIFANAKGQTAGFYHNLAKTVEEGTVIQLPEINRDGYQAYWVTKIEGKEYKYKAGQKVTINQTTKFCLNLYKEYTVRFYTANGRNEYTSLRKTVVAGSRIKMPIGNSNGNYSFAGWATKVGGEVAKKQHATVKVKSNLKFYAVQQKTDTSGIRLYKYDGSYWKTIKNTNGKATFPAVNLGSANIVLGWSKTQGKNALSSSDYKAGDRIPSKNGRYYMVVFGTSMDRAPATITTPTKFDRVYCVGDSRTVYAQVALGASAPSNVEFIAKSGEGLDWFKSSGYKTLYRSVAKRPRTEKKAVIINLGVNDLKVYCVGDSRTVYAQVALGASAPSNVEFIAKSGEGLDWFKSSGYKTLYRSVAKRPRTEKKAVIINLGVNDLKNSASYVKYMKKAAANLKKYNCKMYYLSVNPVNSAMIKSVNGKARTEAQVAAFNKAIYRGLCSGRKRSFTYINTCTNLQMKGWISKKSGTDIYDGLHYSNQTYLRIFDYCMRYLNR